MALDIEAQAQRLVRVYTQAINRLIERFVGEADIYSPRIESLINQSIRELETLRRYTTKWGRINIEALYAETQAKLGGWAKKAAGGAVAHRAGFEVLNAQAIEALLADPETGFISSMGKAIDGVKDGLWKIQNQAKLLRAQQSAINETIARVGILEGRSIPIVRKEIMRELLSGKPITDLAWLPKLKGLGNDHILGKLAQIPYVKFQNGPGMMRLDKYVDLVIRTKSRQAVTTARRYKLLEMNQSLVRISNTMPLQNDACAMYIGKVFALTEVAAKQYKIPHVKQLPNGGTPFHPNCTHNEYPYFPEYENPKDFAIACAPTPAWALDHTWPEVQKEYEKKGGIKAAVQWNENIKNAQRTGGRERRGTPPLKFDLPPTPEPEGDVRARPPTQDTRSSRVAVGGAADKWVSRINERLESYGGAVTTPEQAVQLGTIASAQIERELAARAGGYAKSNADALAEIAILQQQIGRTVGTRNITDLTEIQQSAAVVALSRLAGLVKTQMESYAALAAIRGEITKEQVAKIRSLGTKALPFLAGSDKDAIAGVQDGTAYIPSAWLTGISKSPLRVTAVAGRGTYSADNETAPPTIPLTPGMSKDQQAAAAVHALIHAAEDNLPELRAVEAAYYRKRQQASGETSFKWLGYPYGRDEVGIRDRWKDRFLGRWYEGDNYELLAVGVQALMGLGDRYLSYRLSHDKEFLRFALGCLLGV